MENTFVTLVHEKEREGGKKSKIERSMLLNVAEKALRDSERKANLNWTLPANSPFEFSGGALVQKKKKD